MSPTPAKSTISSNRCAISARFMPMMAPCRIDVLPAGEVRVKPGCHLDQRPDPAAHRAAPVVGLRILVSSFSVVDLPAPFGPMMPRASPGLTSNDTLRSAQNSWSPNVSDSGGGSGTRRPWPEPDRAGCRARSPRRNFFETLSKDNRRPTSDALRELELEPMKDDPGDARNTTCATATTANGTPGAG